VGGWVRRGRSPGQILVAVGSRGGLFAGTATASAGEFTVFPHPPSLTQPALPPGPAHPHR